MASSSGTVPLPAAVWAAFQQFALQEFDCTDEYLLFQAGDSDVMNDSYLDFCRGFYISDSNGESWWEQFHAEFRATSPFCLGFEQDDLFSTDCDSDADFIDRVEAMPLFQTACRAQGWTFSLYHCQP